MKAPLRRITRAAFAVLAAWIFCAAVLAMPAKAEEGVLGDSVWEHLFTIDAVAGGLVQSVCVTDQYIITIENVADSPEFADVVSAYYKNDHDRDGNPVEQFSLANRVQLEEWEHGNGMCWNPVKNEIYVTLYTNTIPENRGCLYVMDPDTLMRKGVIKVTDDFNLLAITYDNANDRYFIQTNSDREYSVMIMNSDFQIVEDMGPESADPGYNFQDFTMVGEYLLQFPLTWNMGIGEFMMAFSIPQNDVVDTIQLFFDELPDEKHIEPESVAWLDPYSFIVPVNATAHDDSRRCLFYRVSFPHLVAPPAPTSEESRQQLHAVSEVSSTSVESIAAVVNVTKGNQELSRTEEAQPKKKFPVWIIVVVLLLIAFLLAGGMYVRHVRIERAKREARMRKKRRIMLANIEKERAGIRSDTQEDLLEILERYGK